jgi:hypothetical protein
MRTTVAVAVAVMTLVTGATRGDLVFTLDRIEIVVGLDPAVTGGAFAAAPVEAFLVGGRRFNLFGAATASSLGNGKLDGGSAFAYDPDRVPGRSPFPDSYEVHFAAPAGKSTYVETFGLFGHGTARGSGDFAFAGYVGSGSGSGSVAVPEPGSLALVAAGLPLVAAWWRTRGTKGRHGARRSDR